MSFRPVPRAIGLSPAIVAAALVLVTGFPSRAARSLVRLPLKGPRVLRQLHERNIDVLAFHRDGTVDVAADGRQMDFLLSLGVPVSVVSTPEMERASLALDANLGAYHTYAEMDSTLTALAAGYPSLTNLMVIGQSIEGRNIYVLKISDNAAVDENEPEVLYMGNHHAREIMSVEIPIKFAIYLLTNYGTDPTVTAMVDAREIYIAPMINPDGHVYVEQNHSGAWWTWWRKNRRDNGNGTFGVDPNRNYGYMWGFDDFGSSPNPSSEVYRGTAAFSEPETQAVRDFCNARNISLALSYHSYGELLLFGWGYIFDYTPDHEVFLAVGDSLASSNGYFVGNPAMGAIYITNGDTDDWAYGDTSSRNKIFGFTPEVNSSADGGFGPPDTVIQPTFDLLVPMNMLLLQLGDNPYRLVGPYAPTLLTADNTFDPNIILSWSGDDPADPNPVVSYDVIEYKNMGTLAQDPANGASPLWTYGGFSPSTARAFEGTGSYYSGAVDNRASTLTAATFYHVDAQTDTFRARAWYDIELDWDYAYFQVSTDGGVIWRSVPGNLTTNTNPNGNNRGNGITGTSPGWVEAVFPLTAYMNQDIDVRFNYITDASFLLEGIYIDLPGPVPTFESEAIVSTGVTDTSTVRTPAGPGVYTYRIRARDTESDAGHWSNAMTTTVSNVATGIGDAPPLATRLGRNYPNPFNPVTRLPYAVGASNGPVRVTLAVYDVTGARVATLVDRELPSGVYQAAWTGRNGHGEPMASGVYFARLTVAGEAAPIRKLVLLK